MRSPAAFLVLPVIGTTHLYHRRGGERGGGGGGRNFDEFHPFLSRDIVGLSCSSKEILLQGRKRAKKVQQLIRPLNFDLKGKKALTVDPTPRAKKTKERDSTSRKV